MLSDTDWSLIYDAAVKRGASRDTAKSWRKRKTIPAEWVPKLEADTGIPRSKMRSDLWPNESAA